MNLKFSDYQALKRDSVWMMNLCLRPVFDAKDGFTRAVDRAYQGLRFTQSVLFGAYINRPRSGGVG